MAWVVVGSPLSVLTGSPRKVALVPVAVPERIILLATASPRSILVLVRPVISPPETRKSRSTVKLSLVRSVSAAERKRLVSDPQSMPSATVVPASN